VAALDHPHVARAYRFGRLEDETPYLVMRLVKGRTMQDRLKAEGALLPELAIPVLRDVASALTAVHAIGIVHRDVRPANVLWDEENDKALLVDFGISTLFTTSGLEMAVLNEERPLIGDPKCLSPEQIRDDRVAVRADIYAFGVMAYELLTDQGPYEAGSDTEWRTSMVRRSVNGSGGRARSRERRPSVCSVRSPGRSRTHTRKGWSPVM